MGSIQAAEIERLQRQNLKMAANMDAIRRALHCDGWPLQSVIDRCKLLNAHYASTGDPLAQPHPDEVNPDHKVTQAMRSQWHKIMALTMHQRGISEVTITIDDLNGFPPDFTVVSYDGPQGLRISLLSMADAIELAAKHGQRLQPGD